MPESQTVIGSLEVGADMSLFRKSWPLHAPKANVLIVHGYAEYCERYDHVAERLNEHGYAVYSYDQRGHGNSPGTLGQIPSFDALTDDLAKVLNTLQDEVDEHLPFFIWGHSMGGLVTSACTIRHQPDITGLVLTSPGVKADETVSPVLKALSGIIAAVLPKVPVHALDPTGISRDEVEVKKYIEDPLVYHGKILAQTGNQLVKTIDFVEANYGKITVPTLIMHGTEDRLVNVIASEALHAGMSSSDKTLKIYDGGYHELFNDIIREEFFTDLFAWLDAHC
ncbi:MAG: alpha/beta hydrolase [Candidatus Hydrogenedentota bacterium]